MWGQVRKDSKLSWHYIRTFTRAPGRAIGLCGRSIFEPFHDERPSGKSCESCLRKLETLNPED